MIFLKPPWLDRLPTTRKLKSHSKALLSLPSGDARRLCPGLRGEIPGALGPYHAKFGKKARMGKRLLDILDRIPDSGCASDQEAIDAWAEELDIDGWCAWQSVSLKKRP